MHFSVIMFGILIAFLSSVALIHKAEGSSGLNIRAKMAKHTTLFEFTIIYGLLIGILIDLLIGDALYNKLWGRKRQKN